MKDRKSREEVQRWDSDALYVNKITPWSLHDDDLFMLFIGKEYEQKEGNRACIGRQM